MRVYVAGGEGVPPPLFTNARAPGTAPFTTFPRCIPQHCPYITAFWKRPQFNVCSNSHKLTGELPRETSLSI